MDRCASEPTIHWICKLPWILIDYFAHVKKEDVANQSSGFLLKSNSSQLFFFGHPRVLDIHFSPSCVKNLIPRCEFNTNSTGCFFGKPGWASYNSYTIHQALFTRWAPVDQL